LEELKQDPRFRKDLFYRLQSHHVSIPPLRERMGDVPLLTAHFLRRAAEEQGKAAPTAPPELAVILSNYHFPGNVRELRGMIYDAVSRHTGRVLSCNSIRDAVKIGTGTGKPPAPSGGVIPDIQFPLPLPTAPQAETALIREALKRAGENKSMAAELIGMARQTFRTKLKKLETGG
jgi:DNA-binding NtrC family response regulator